MTARGAYAAKGLSLFLRWVIPFLVLSVLPVATAYGHDSRVRLDVVEKTLTIYVIAGSNGPLLTLDQNEANHSAGQVQLSSGGGPDATLRSLQGEPSPAFPLIELPKPLASTMFLNLTKTVSGAIHWTSDTAQSTKHEAARVRVELLLNNTRIGGIEWFSQNDKDWQVTNLGFRPEVNQLDVGKKLALRITQFSGLSDFRLGTGGAHASKIVLAYYDEDPLGGVLVMKNGVLQNPPHAPATNSTSLLPADPSGLPFAGFLVAAPLGLLTLSRCSRRAALASLLVLLFLAAALGGCLGGKKALPATVAPPDSLRPIEPFSEPDQFVWDLALKKTQSAGVRGYVRDWLGFPIEKVNVSLTGTSRFSVTDASGMFTFKNLSTENPRLFEYVLYFEHDDFLYFEAVVETRLEHYTWKNVTVVRPEEAGTDGNEHLHNDFGSLTQKLVYRNDDGFLPVSGSMTAISETEWVCAQGNGGCTAPIPLDYEGQDGIKIYTGTKRVQVKLSWDTSGDYAPPELGLGVATNANPWASNYVYRGPNEPFNISIFPYEADPGHQAFTNWEFTIRAPPIMAGAAASLSANPATMVQAPYWKGGKVQVEIIAFKGKVPYEPPHGAFWKGKTELPIIHDAHKAITCEASLEDYPSPNCRWKLAMLYVYNATTHKDDYLLVPPGTKTIKGRFVVSASPSSTLTNWGLQYKGADVGAGSMRLETVDLLAVGSNGPTETKEYDFTISLAEKPGSTDSFYQSKSNWIFYPTDNQDPVYQNIGITNGASDVRFELTATAVRDPSSNVK